MTPIPAWVNDYIGIPFVEKGRDRRGCDCWGLCRLVMGDRSGIWLPSYLDEYRSAHDGAGVGAAITENKGGEWEEVQGAREGDFILFRGVCGRSALRGMPMHVAYSLGGRMMLHIIAGIDSCWEWVDGPAWRNRMIGIYRYRPEA